MKGMTVGEAYDKKHGKAKATKRKAAGTKKQLEAREKTGTITAGDKMILDRLREQAKKIAADKAKRASKVINIIKSVGSGIKKSVEKRTGGKSMYEKHNPKPE